MPPARDVIFTFSYLTWDGASRRGMCFPEDRLAEALVRDSRVGRVLVCNMARSLPVKLVRDLLRRPAPFPERDGVGLLEPLRLRRRDPVGAGGLERWYAAYERRMRRGAERLGLKRPVVITASPLVAGLPRFDWAGPVTFYATDEWTAYRPMRRWWRGYDEAYEGIRTHGRRVCAVTPAIVEKIDPRGPRTVVPNGIDPGEWGEPGPAPRWLEGLPRPLLLYVGSLDDRIDVVRLERALEELPQASLVLLGPLLDEAHLAPLLARPEVHHHPPVGRRELTAAISGADACLLPHRRTRLTRAMSPLKLYEYLAAGRPVAATDLPPVRGVSDRVALCPDAGSYADAVRAALALGPAPEAERRRFLADNSWERRHERILEFALA